MKNKDEILASLSEIIKKGNFSKDEDMGKHTSFRAGGKASVFVEPGNENELLKILELFDKKNVEHYIMGNGSNILVKDGGYRGGILHLGTAFNQVVVNGEELTAGAGMLLSEVAKLALENQLAGLEFASGIPGSLGGAIYMNAGAYGEEMKDVLVRVTAISKINGVYKIINKEINENDLMYRNSIFQINKDVILGGTVKLFKGNKKEIESKMKELNGRRSEKQPLNLPSAGSFFKRPEGEFAGKLIQDCGLKGKMCGMAQVSELHAGFIVNAGGATATDIVKLKELVQNTVYDKTGIMLQEEVRIIGE